MLGLRFVVEFVRHRGRCGSVNFQPELLKNRPATLPMLNIVGRRTLFQSKFVRSIATSLPVPSLGDSISDGTLVEFSVELGQSVSADGVVAVIETDKVSIDIRSPFAGTVTELLVNPDDTVVVGQVLMTLDSDVVATVESSTGSAEPTAPAPLAAAAAPSPPPQPLPTTSTPTTATVPSTTTAASHGRQPRIRFRHGDRAVIDANRFALPSSGQSVQTNVGDEDFLALPFLYRRLPMSDKEMDMINMGGAHDDEDVDVTMRYI